MPPRLRKLIGTVALVVFVTFYALIAMTIGAAKLPGTSYPIQVGYYATAGLLWVLPAGAIIAWMLRPGRKG